MPEYCDGGYRPDDFTDAGNGQLYRDCYRGLLVYTDALGWLDWNGKVWERGDHRAMVRAEVLSLNMLCDAYDELAWARRREEEAKDELAREQPGAKAKLEEAGKELAQAGAYLAHAQRTRQASRLNAMVELAKHNMVVRAEQLDADPYLLNTPGGEVDLRTGELKSHDGDSPYRYCTRITAATPEHTMEGTTLWYRFLETITCGDGQLAMFLQRAVGMALVGKVFHEGILLAVGGGRNGKSTFFNALAAVLGDYAGNLDVNVLTNQRQNRGPALATLRGKRLVLASELEENQALSTSTLKQLASADRLVIEEKYRTPEAVEQTHSLVLFTNHLPRVRSTDNGTWRRLTVLPFRAVIEEKDAVADYAGVLAEQAGSTILAWAVDGARQFLADGCKLELPEAVARATAEYRAQEDWLSRFFAARCRMNPDARTGARELYLHYKQWAEECGEFARSERAFAEEMKARGMEKKKLHGNYTYKGLMAGTG